jgi:aspartate carbamoyltransferase
MKNSKNTLEGKDILTADQFNYYDIEFILNITEQMKQIDSSREHCDILKGKILAAIFYQPSSRTFGSFLAAMQRLGGGIIPIQGVEYSSVAKGEDLKDTIETFSNYSDVIALRHPDNNSSIIAAEASNKPIINAGSGTNEHPTQAILDIATINYFVSQNDKRRKNVVLTMVGDLLNGRTVHSLLKIWPTYLQGSSSTVYLVSPDETRMPIDLINEAKRRGLKIEETNSLEDALPYTNVLYMTRVQKEWFKDQDLYERIKNRYILTPEMMELAKPPGEMIIMHPLPRVGEIPHSIDNDPRAWYLKVQEPYGLWSRMAILAAVLGVV